MFRRIRKVVSRPDFPPSLACLLLIILKEENQLKYMIAGIYDVGLVNTHCSRGHCVD